MENSKSYNQPPVPPPYYEDDEISLKELILKIQEFWREVWKNKGWIILAAALIAGLFFIRTRSQRTTYTSSLTFLVSNSTKTGSSELAEALGYGAPNYNLNKVVELARSRRIINKVLIKKVAIGDKNDFIANHLINIYNFHERWEKESKSNLYEELQLKDFFFTHSRIEDFYPREYRALVLLGELLGGNSLTNREGLMKASYEKKVGMVQLTVVTKHKNLSIQLIDAVFEVLNDFYIEEAVGRPRNFFNLLKQREDSVLLALNRQEEQLALASDRNANLISKVSNLNLGRLSRKLQTTTHLYQEIIKNKEKLEFTLASETPEFQVIDRTFIPLVTAPSKLRALLIGGFLGGFLVVGYVICRKIIRNAMEG